MRKSTAVLVAILALAWGGYLLWDKKVGTVSIPQSSDDAPLTLGGEPVPFLNAPLGFKISLHAKDVPGVRVLALDDAGMLWVSQTSKGKISKIDTNGNPTTVLAELKKPHGLIFDNAGNLYFAEETKLSILEKGQTMPEKLLDLPQGGGGHFTRSLLWLPSDESILLISVGSTCNVCDEDDPRNAAILYYDTRNKESGIYAKGLRNAVFMATDPVSGRVYATEMGRDNLGDDLPPDEINIIEQKNNRPQNYGWPICYGKNIHDTDFDKKTYIRNPCMAPTEVPSFIDLQAHSAPLGLAFIPEEGWPEEYWYDLLVAYHGSWNRSVPTGYKIVRLKIDAKGNYSGTEDFITGWLISGGNPSTSLGARKLGRPVDIKTFPGGTAYISDDEAGVIYKLTRTSDE